MLICESAQERFVGVLALCSERVQAKAPEGKAKRLEKNVKR